MPNLFDFKSKSTPVPFEIKAKAGDTKAEIIMYDSIGEDFWTGGGITAKSVDAELKKMPSSVNEINIRMNSPGGDVFEGIAIYNRLKQHKAKKIVHIDGLAASIASIIMLAGDEIIIGEGALVMIHLPWTGQYGNRMDFENVINTLSTIEQQMIGIYARKTGLERVEIQQLLEKETWFNAEEALEKKFVTSKVATTTSIAASALDKVWMRKAPRNLVTDKDQVRNKISELKNKIDARIARK